MLEDRKHFIMRIQMMIQEIKMSNLDDACIYSMIDFQLRQREKDIVFTTKINVMSKFESSGTYKSLKKIRKLGNKAFNEIINKI